MSATEIVVIVVGIVGMIAAIIYVGLALEKREARKLASVIVGLPCPSCGSLFQMNAVRSAHLEHGFDEPSYCSVVCSACCQRCLVIEGKLIKDSV